MWPERTRRRSDPDLIAADAAVVVEGIAKAYRIGLRNEMNDTFAGALASWVRAPLRNFRTLRRLNTFDDTCEAEDTLWALRDISFEVKRGEVLGILGRNGAGKSTLLKILSRITEPTRGRAIVNGRISSLLEVGTGFHPELTGRENVYLNATILGMTKREAARKFDEIVAFSGVERFIDTPVKRYSSGMKVRLAFSVAAHLEPEVLVIDEVLSVGDFEFQQKCIGKMGELSQGGSGRTVLFVSHNLAAIRALCTRGIVLEAGRVEFDGGVVDAVQMYRESGAQQPSAVTWRDPDDAPGNDHIRLREVGVQPLAGEVLDIRSGVRIGIEFLCFDAARSLDLTLELTTSDGVVVFHRGTILSRSGAAEQGVYTIETSLPPDLLNAGIYHLTLIFGENQRYLLYRADDVVRFEVGNVIERVGGSMHVKPGIIRPRLDWNVEFSPLLHA